MQRTPFVAICVATYRRETLLATLLASLEFTTMDDYYAEVFIVDNDGEGSAEPTAFAWSHNSRFKYHYAIESSKGLANVRNRLVDMARVANADYIAFVDDDQRVDPLWLVSLVRTAMRWRADAVVGRYIIQYDDDTPEWAKNPRYFGGSVNLPTGTPAKHFNTGNLLLRLSSMDQFAILFDTRLNASGGEDTVFSERCYRSGLKAVRCSESIVYEYVPREKASVGSRLRRALRSGGTLAQAELFFERSPSTYARLGVKSSLRIVRGSLVIIAGLARGRSAMLYGGMQFASGLGGLYTLVRRGSATI